jgi:hypothetical protein
VLKIKQSGNAGDRTGEEKLVVFVGVRNRHGMFNQVIGAKVLATTEAKQQLSIAHASVIQSASSVF